MFAEINLKLLNYLKTESGCINIWSSNDENGNNENLITFKFDLLNPEHSTEEIWKNVTKILEKYNLVMSECERIKDNVVRVKYIIKE